MENCIQNWHITSEAFAELARLNRKNFLKLLPYIAVVIAGAIVIISPKKISYKDAIQALTTIIAMLMIFFGFLYWYFGSSKFVSSEYGLQRTGTHVSFILGEMTYENPKLRILSELENEYIVEINTKATVLASIPKEIYNSVFLSPTDGK